MSAATREHLDQFWELIDEVLNAVLFVLIGLELLLISFEAGYLIAGVCAIPLVLISRFIAVGTPITVLSRLRSFSPMAIRVLTWGGLRGGISIALALAIPVDAPAREPILTITYVVVVFSILVQGLTIGKLVQRAVAQGAPLVPEVERGQH